jgi:hypothetical protein
VPMQLVKFITVESTTFADAERRRLNYMAEIETNQDAIPDLEA